MAGGFGGYQFAGFIYLNSKTSKQNPFLFVFISILIKMQKVSKGSGKSVIPKAVLEHNLGLFLCTWSRYGFK